MGSQNTIRLQMLALPQQIEIEFTEQRSKGIGIAVETLAAITERNLNLIGAGGRRQFPRCRRGGH